MRNGDTKLLDAIIDLGLAVGKLTSTVVELQSTVKVLDGKVELLGHEIKGLQKQQARTNAELGEIRLSFIQYAQAIEKVIDHDRKVIDHEKRIGKLERAIMKD